MKVLLFDIENQLDKDLVTEAQELVRDTREYDISSPEPGKYHCMSRQPDYHVEITLREEGIAIAKCHCLVYKKSGKCRHAVAALILLRDYQQRNRRSKKKSKQETVEEILRRMNVGNLKSFIGSYAMSHSGLRTEILSNFLHLTKKPDYHSLYNDIAPVDKYGQIRVNRNNLKTIRGVTSTLLKRAQHSLKEQSPSETLSILEAVLTHLHRLLAKVPQFHDQLLIELRHAYKLFELLCSTPMAPRLQHRATSLSQDLCSRESYFFPSGWNSLISITEKFFLEEKTRKEAFAIAEHKALSGSSQKLKWVSLLYHWMRLWSFKVSNADLRQQMEKMLPEVIKDLSQQGAFEDILFLSAIADKKKFDPTSVQSILQSGLRAAKVLGEKEKLIMYAYELSLHHLDIDAWGLLFEAEKQKAVHVLNIIEEIYSPSSDPNADLLLLRGWHHTGDGKAMIKRLKHIQDIDMAMNYDLALKENFTEDLEELYAGYVISIRETYGGSMAKQKLNNIFNHLKTINLHQQVLEKIKQMDKQKQEDPVKDERSIQGFVFDLDGVIVDTAVHHFQSWKKILHELGAELTEDDDHHTRGAGRMESLEYLIHRHHIKLTEEEKLHWAAKKNRVYLEAINSITPADMLPGAMSFLEDSRKLGLLLGLGSASKNARSVLEKLKIADRFDAIVDGNDAKASKPDPEVFLKATAALGLQPSTVVVFEDAAKGVQAAIRAGCKTVGIGDVSTLSAADIVVPGLGHIQPSQIIEQIG